MLDGMEAYVGRKLKPEVFEHYGNPKEGGSLVTRPDFYSCNMHINMNIHFNEEGVITDFTGNKCYSSYTGLYNRSAEVHKRTFSKRDMAYLRKYVKTITVE